MSNQAFLTGFAKQAQFKGITHVEAMRLAKEAGFWDTAGNVAKGVGQFGWDMIGKPAVGMVKDPFRAMNYAAHGQFHNAFNAAGSALGNTALTAINFIPGGGFGSMAARGGLRLAGMGGKALEAGIMGARAARAGGRLAEGAQAAHGAFGAAQAATQGALAGGAGRLGNSVGLGMQQMGDKFLNPSGMMGRATDAVGGAMRNGGNQLQQMGARFAGTAAPVMNDQLATAASRPGFLNRTARSMAGTAITGLPMNQAMGSEQAQQEDPYAEDPQSY